MDGITRRERPTQAENALLMRWLKLPLPESCTEEEYPEFQRVMRKYEAWRLWIHVEIMAGREREFGT